MLDFLRGDCFRGWILVCSVGKEGSGDSLGGRSLEGEGVRGSETLSIGAEDGEERRPSEVADSGRGLGLRPRFRPRRWVVAFSGVSGGVITEGEGEERVRANVCFLGTRL